MVGPGPPPIRFTDQNPSWHDADMDDQRAQLEAFYRRYIQRCNDRGFDDLGEFVDPDVEVNGKPHGLQAYADGLASVIELVPDFHWDLRHLLIDGCWLSAHLTDTGTAAGNWPVNLQEFAVYRLAGGRIIEVWGDLDRNRLTA